MDGPSPGQIYRSPSGRPVFFVRTECYGGVLGHVFACTHARTVFLLRIEATRWEAECLYDLVVDTYGRAEAEFMHHELQEMSRKQDALIKTLNHVATIVPREAVEELRKFYSEALRDGT